MPSKLRHITRRRKNARATLNKINYGVHSPAAVTRMNEEKATLDNRISGGAHSTAWYRKQARKKPVVQEAESA